MLSSLSLGDRIFEDRNGNGRVEPVIDTGIVGAQVHLYSDDGTAWTRVPHDDTLSGSGASISTTPLIWIKTLVLFQTYKPSRRKSNRCSSIL